MPSKRHRQQTLAFRGRDPSELECRSVKEHLLMPRTRLCARNRKSVASSGLPGALSPVHGLANVITKHCELSLQA